MTAESLSEQIGRAKARWLKRVMQDPAATSTQKCLAYAIADFLNCVTLDCWPAQPTLARALGHKSVKTVQRAGRGLAMLRLITLKRAPSGHAGCRYAPVFWPEDMDKSVLKTGHRSLAAKDINDRESFLNIHTKSFSTEVAGDKSSSASHSRPSINPSERGAIEIKLAKMFGPNGLDVLGRLASIDDAIIDRLIRAYSEGALSERDLAAARLAAEQA